ncbi:uncharacterized protein DUF4387 [Albidovulum inexpectatum]|uniref:Uncharacterized protein DUF4387 n=1 Tax=Albidovulum inexpectatum TaxID=196587 RepID=A0A2S5JMQ4_9RHOB|nr:DUF4387 family protein [Albidovulum inexpectatum]PPB82681.1 uncharacterized protein DUF4387 [Albidovulum inexpectatum]
MAEIGQIARKVRSKNAGPFWLTIDIFCGDRAAYDRIRLGLATEAVARAFHMPHDMIKRFEIADLNVVKFSLPRPSVQGTRADRDMHGAAWAVLVEEMDIP